MFSVLFLVSGMLIAAEPTVDLSAAPAEVAVGDRVVVTLTWSWPSGWQVLHEPDPAVDFRDCFVTDAPPVIATHTAEGERRSIKLTVLANRSGAWALPRPSLTVQGPGEPKPATIQAPPVVVQVGAEAAPAKLPEAIPPRVRPPEAPASDHRWWYVAAGLAGLAAIVIVMILRRRAAAAVTVPPIDRFTEELRRASATQDGKELGGAISLALRRYAGEVFRFDGAGSTTREVAAQLAARKHPDDERRSLVRLLERLDDLRWAAGELDVGLVRPLTDDAAAWVAGVERRLAAEAEAKRAPNAERPAPSTERPAPSAGGAR